MRNAGATPKVIASATESATRPNAVPGLAAAPGKDAVEPVEPDRGGDEQHRPELVAAEDVEDRADPEEGVREGGEVREHPPAVGHGRTRAMVDRPARKPSGRAARRPRAAGSAAGRPRASRGRSSRAGPPSVPDLPLPNERDEASRDDPRDLDDLDRPVGGVEVGRFGRRSGRRPAGTPDGNPRPPSRSSRTSRPRAPGSRGRP